MAKARLGFKACGNFIAGQFEMPAESNGELLSRSPADFSDELGRFPYSYRAVDAAVGAARAAFAGWRRTSCSERAELLRKFRDAFRRRGEELGEAIAREIGTPSWEAAAEIDAVLTAIDAVLEDGMKTVADLVTADGQSRHRPLGVLAIIGPFSSPALAPCGHAFPALLTGNTVVFKPSEKAPLVGQLLTECFADAGFPRGVFNLLQGEKEVGRRLVVHEQVDGVLFTGSYEVGMRIKQDTLLQHWKLLALEMGAKNPAIVWEDADMKLALHHTLVGAFQSAGQRCTSTSRIIVHRQHVAEFVERFHDRAKAFSIGHPLENPFMGPLIDSGSVDRYMKFVGIAIREGAELVMRGKSLDLKAQGNYVTPSICWLKDSSFEQTRKSVYQQAELFAPNVAVLAVDTLEEAIAQANLTQYGLVASIFTRDPILYAKCRDELQFGLVNWNRPTLESSPRLPFGGLKKSGNYMPTGIRAAAYCMVPVSSLESEVSNFPGKLAPGLNWK